MYSGGTKFHSYLIAILWNLQKGIFLILYATNFITLTSHNLCKTYKPETYPSIQLCFFEHVNFYLIQKQPSYKKSVRPPKKANVKKDVKSKVVAKNGCDGL